MARFTVNIFPQARRDLDRLSADVGRRILRKIPELEQGPFSRGDTVKILQGFDPPMVRLRIGDYRVVYRIQVAEVVILRVIHRGELFRALRDRV